VFKSESEENEELGFADAYKNEILKNREPQKDTSYKGLIVIISLVTFVLGGAIFGYIYFNNSSNDTEEIVEKPEESKLMNIDDIEEDENESELNSSVDNTDKENYIEDLAKLSKGIDEGM